LLRVASDTRTLELQLQAVQQAPAQRLFEFGRPNHADLVGQAPGARQEELGEGCVAGDEALALRGHGRQGAEGGALFVGEQRIAVQGAAAPGRRVLLHLTAQAEARLADLSAAHLEELGKIGPILDDIRSLM
jgi:hypothetical protein